MRASTICPTNVQKNNALSLLFLGGDAFSIGVLEPLLASKASLWSDLLVVTSGEKQIGRGSRGSRRIVPPLLTFAQDQGLETSTLPATGFKDWQVDLRPATSAQEGSCRLNIETMPQPPAKYLSSSTLNSDPASDPSSSPILITASFGHIIPTPFLKTHFPEPFTRLNVHPSLLPEYRGAAPIQWSIADSWRDRRAKTGVTVQGLALGRGKVDCGDVWSQEGDITIDENATYESMLPTLARRGGELLVSTLSRIRDGTASSYPQPLEGSFRKASKITPATARVDFEMHSATQIEARHRAFGFQEPIWTTMNGVPLQLLDVALVTRQDPDLSPGQARFDRPNNRLLVRCADASSSGQHREDALLEVKRVHQAGKRALSVRDWWNGLRGVGKGTVVELGT